MLFSAASSTCNIYLSDYLQINVFHAGPKVPTSNIKIKFCQKQGQKSPEFIEHLLIRQQFLEIYLTMEKTFTIFSSFLLILVAYYVKYQLSKFRPKSSPNFGLL